MLNSNVVYIGLGIFDAFAVLVMMLSLYKLSIWNRMAFLIPFVTCISLFSYLMRIVLHLPLYDSPMQYIFFILLIHYVYRLRLDLAIFVAGAGFTSYIALQLTIYQTFNFLGILDSTVLKQNVGIAVYTIQIGSIVGAYFIAGFLTIFNLGFSFIQNYPNVISDEESTGQRYNDTLFKVSVLISSLTVMLNSILLYTSNSVGLLLMSLFTFSISFFLSQKKDYEDLSSKVEVPISKNKKD